MAQQTTKSKSKSATGRSGARTKRSSSNAHRAKSTSSASRSRSTAQSRNGAEAVKETAIDKTKAAGNAVAQAASKAKTPLIAGGTALAGAGAVLVIKDQLDANRSKSPLKRLRNVSMPKPAAHLRNLDLDTVKSTAERVSAYGRQVADLAAAAEKTQKKNG